MSKKKIAYILHCAYENEGRVYKISQSLANAGYGVNIFATWKKGLPLRWQEGKVGIERLYFPILNILKVPLYKVRLFMPFYTIKLLSRIWRYKPNITHCTNLWTLHIGYLSKLLFNIPYVYDSEELFISQNHMNNKPAIIRKLYMIYEKFFAKRAAVILQTTKSRSKQFQKFYGIKSKVIMNKALAPKLKENLLNANKYLKLKTTKKRLVYVGLVLPQRGIEQLVEATSGMNNVQLFVLGRPNGPWGYNLLKKYKKQISWIPSVVQDKVLDALSVFDIGISLIQNSCPSYYFSCPTKVWELIASGTPQIASDFPEIRKLIRDNEVGAVGRVVDPTDINQIRKNIKEMLDNPEELKMYRKNCLKLRRLCTWDIEAKKLVNIYNSINLGRVS